MEIKGKIILDLGAVSGTSKAGNNWKKHEYVLETQETYPKKVHFDFFGDNADRINLTVGQRYTVSFDIDAHEYNGRWFNEIRAWRAVDAQAAAAPQPAQVSQPAQAAPAAPADLTGTEEEFPF